MRSLTLVFTAFLLLFPALGQTTKPKPAASKTKPTTAKPKTSGTPAKKTTTATKPKPKPSGTPEKKTATTTKIKPTSTAEKKTATADQKKPASTSSAKPGEKAAFEKASKIADATQRVAALQKFNSTYPKSTRKNDALALMTTARGEIGNARLTAKDVPGAITIFKAAADDAPKPVPDAIWTDVLSKVPLNLFFRGGRDEAFAIAKVLEDKTDGNKVQILDLASFYLNVENGTEARRLAERVIAVDPTSAAAYQTLGLANRIDFQLEESATAYAKALELEPDSLTARRGLAEAKRSLGRSDEAVVLYREILAKDEANVPAHTGLVLALFESEKRSDAEAELAKALEANDGNVMLLAGAAYWYAAHREGSKAVDLAQKAIAADPRFIWSHIALARGFLLQGKPGEAEKVLFNAQQYGNFPTMDYEVASARLAAGYFRDAAEVLARTFTIKDGAISTKLGGRVLRDSKNFTELVGFERRASTFAPVAADDPENAARLAALLELKQAIDAPEPNAELVVAAVDRFTAGDDKMRVFRLIYAASVLLDKRVALPKVMELTRAASTGVDPGLELPNAGAAVMASEIYEARAMAATRGEYVNVPEIPRSVLSAVIRGRIEDIAGWAQFQLENHTESAIRLRRAVNVLPVESAWWRASMWHLGTALAASGKDAEALEAYIKVYKGGSPDPLRYTAIETVYKRVKGNLDGLETQIGSNPMPPVPEKVIEPGSTEKPDPAQPAPIPSPSPV